MTFSGVTSSDDVYRSFADDLKFNFWEEAASITTSTQIDALFKIQISLLQQAFSKRVVVYPENSAIP